jgi:hypothetical protein
MPLASRSAVYSVVHILVTHVLNKKKAAETIEFSLSLSLNQAEEDERVCIKDASRSKQTCYSERRKKKLN